MARKHIGTILSSGILICCVLFMASDVNAQSLTMRKTQYQISGSVGVPGVVMKGLPGAVISDSAGQYRATVDYGWSGSITPTLDGYEFTPRSRSVSPVKAHVTNNDFAGKIQMYVVSGTVGMPNVTLHGFAETVVSDPAGKFQVQVPYGTTLTLMPVLEGYSFTPSTLQLSQVNRNFLAQRFVSARKTYSVSGMVSSVGVPVSNVTLKVRGGNKAIKVGADGRYAVQATHGESLDITPEREGYTFYPATMSYVDVTADEVTNYDATQLRYTITGSAGAPNVLIRYSGGSELSDAMGNYSIELNHGARVSIKPERDGYRFSPPELSHMKLVGNLVSQNFVASEIEITIRGNTGTPGVLLDGLIDLAGRPVTSDAQGNYVAKVRYNSTLAVIPIKPGYTFQPASRPYTSLTLDQLSETYKAEAMSFEISGNVGMREVVMVGPQGRFTSDPAGGYTVLVPYDWSGIIKPELPGYEFDPPSMSYQNVTENLYSNQNYSVQKKIYVISGLVTSPDGPVEGAIIQLGGLGGDSAVTDTQGRYSLGVEYARTGKISVEKSGYDFVTPLIDLPPVVQSREFSFTGKIRMLKIRGRLLFDGQPVSAVRLIADNNGGVAASDAQGRWLIEVPYGWSGQISMEKPGIEIDDVLVFSDPLEQDKDLTRPDTPVVTPPVDTGSSTRVDPGDTTPRVDDGSRLPEDIFPSDNAFKELDNDANNVGGTRSSIAPEVLALREQLQKLQEAFERQRTGKPDNTGDVNYRGPVVSAQTFSEEDLVSVFNLISDEVGIPIITDSEVIMAQTSVSFDAIPLEDALDILVVGTNFSWTKAEAGYYLISTMAPVNPAFIAGSVTQTIKMGNLTATNAVAMLSQSMQQFVKAEPMGSYVIVTAGPKIAERILNDLRSFDISPKQVLLQSKVVVMEEGDLLNMGVEWSFPQVNAGLFAADYRNDNTSEFNSGGVGMWGVQMGYSLGSAFTSALTMGLNLLQENDKAQMIATPSTMAADGKLATMSVITEEYFMLTPQLTSTQVFSQSELEKIESGVKLEITPRISDSNEIILEIAVELSDSIPSGRASRLPVVTRRTASNTVRVMNGGSAVIAGLNENRKTVKDKRTPGFSSIPLIGRLFSNTYNDTASRDVAIFVTANIIDDEQPAARPVPVATPPVIPAFQPPMGNMNNFAPGTNMAPGTMMPRPQYNTPPAQYYNTPNAAPPRTQYDSTPNVNPPGSYDSFQAELRRTIAEQRLKNNTAFNN
jgi:Flp pilus assembly secretin CpaC